MQVRRKKGNGTKREAVRGSYVLISSSPKEIQARSRLTSQEREALKSLARLGPFYIDGNLVLSLIEKRLLVVKSTDEEWNKLTITPLGEELLRWVP